jgi:hypothetical protein
MPSLKLAAITPKNLPQAKEYLRAIEAGNRKTTKLTQRDLESTVRTWDHKVKFEVVEDRSGGDYSLTAGTDDKIYGYVNDGTKPHVIKAKKSRFLSFAGGPYKAKTRVGMIGSRPGGASGAKVVAQQVNHPGFPGRNFIAVIAKRRQKTLEQETTQNIAKVARKQA